ncbi:LOW QUALITY PROTEIN: plasma protease C1 inhibitor-like [Mobula hypostoma]|uniref:LOW QUALITY PROTEIN: plasma protease C1 inhibitor-like n=1 Tax=Mobula hypostoma TaxID=723540 RepID=UPI002FC330D8
MPHTPEGRLRALPGPLEALRGDPGGLARPADQAVRLADPVRGGAVPAVANVNPDVNLALSPISVATALTHLLLGSRNETWKNLQDALHYTDHFPCVHRPLSELLNRSRNLVSASQLFYREGICLERDFNDRSIRFYGQEPKALTPNATENVRAINDWVSGHTRGLIPKMVDSVPDDVIIMILNAVHYAGKWKTKFEKRLTREEDFWVSSKKMVHVPMMQSVSYPLTAIYSSELNSEVARFQLFGKSSLIVILPQENDRALRDLEVSLEAQKLEKVIDTLRKTHVQPTNVRLPRLKIDFTQELLEPLIEIGLNNALFYPNLCGLTPGAGMSITSVTHRAFVSLDEDGVEAAAATSMSVGRTITVFDAARPFLWMLWDDVLGYPFFMGRVLNPLV